MLLLPAVPLSLNAPGELDTTSLVIAAVQVVALELRAYGVGLFLEHDQRLHLVVSDRIRQDGLDLVAATWAHRPAKLMEGVPLWCGDDERPFLLLPCVVRGAPRGVLYVEMLTVRRRMWPSLLQSLVRLVSRAVAKHEDGLAQQPEEEDRGAPPIDDTEAMVLASALEHNEWNVSRVARVLGVTRMTIYNRMRKMGLPRKRVVKSTKRPSKRRPQAPPTAPPGGVTSKD